MVKNDVAKKDVYNAKIKKYWRKKPEITKLATKTTLNAIKNEVEGEIPNITNFATNASINAKINEIKVETPNITNLATTTTAVLTGVENKIPSISNLVKKTEKEATDHNLDKYITTSEFNQFTAETKTSKFSQQKWC